MGQVCDQVDRKSLDHLEEMVNTTNLSQYQKANLQEIPYLKDKTTHIMNNHLPFTNFTDSRELLKHKTRNIYYLGDWDQAGYQHGKGIIYSPEQYLYYGDFDSVPHGKGVLESISNAFIYEGQFGYGKIDGMGRLESTQGLFVFEGTFDKESHPINGNLRITNPQNQDQSYNVYLNNYPENKAKIVYREGRQFQGDINFNRFVPHGYGVSKYTNNSVYEGQWEEGEFHGKGKFTWSNGSSYEGDYSYGLKHGEGVFIYPSTKVYRGQWQNGRQQGQGTLFDSNQNIIKKGQWVEGKFSEQPQ